MEKYIDIISSILKIIGAVFAIYMFGEVVYENVHYGTQPTNKEILVILVLAILSFKSD